MDQGLQVIGAGFGRTGTLSLKTALERLGFGPCYHMVELLQNRWQIDHWARALKGKPTDWDALFAGYRSAVDFPVCSYVFELMDKYPNAKIILTVRDEDSWYASASNTILSIKPSMRQMISVISRLSYSREARRSCRIGLHNRKLILNPLAKSEQAAKRAYREHNERVRREVPKDRLLEYSVKEGWGPLCEFLGVDVPDEDFPRSNSRERFRDWVLPMFELDAKKTPRDEAQGAAERTR